MRCETPPSRPTCWSTQQTRYLIQMCMHTYMGAPHLSISYYKLVWWDWVAGKNCSNWRSKLHIFSSMQKGLMLGFHHNSVQQQYHSYISHHPEWSRTFFNAQSSRDVLRRPCTYQKQNVKWWISMRGLLTTQHSVSRAHLKLSRKLRLKNASPGEIHPANHAPSQKPISDSAQAGAYLKYSHKESNSSISAAAKGI